MNFTIFLTGDRPESFYLNAIEEYRKRLSRYCKIQLLHLKNEEQLRKKLPERAHRLLVTQLGQTVSSESLAARIDAWGLSGVSDVAIVLGGTNIPHDETLTLSSLDMCPGLQATLLFEQLYRSYRILKGEPYHK